MAKKAMYFTLEAIVAMMVISVGFTIILYLFIALAQAPVQTVQTDLYDTVTILDLELQDISSGECSVRGDLVDEGIISDTSNSFFNQMGEFYFCMNSDSCTCTTDCETEYQEYIYDCLEDFIDYRSLDDMNLQLQIEDTVLYRSDYDSVDHTVIYDGLDGTGNADQENATVLLPFKIMLVGIWNNEETWGPYIGEVRIWQ
jgi:hypothetical protein